MKLYLLISYLFFVSNIFPQKITSFSGLEDNSGNTHLFYRYGFSEDRYNSIYHFDLEDNTDSLFLNAFINYNPGGVTSSAVTAIDFWNNDPQKFIYIRDIGDIDVWVQIEKYNEGSPSFNDGGSAFGAHINISRQNNSLLYASLNELSLMSSNGGKTWNYISSNDEFSFVSLNPYDDSILFGINSSKLVMSNDSGISQTLVDTSKWSWYGTKIYYDADSLHIYGISQKYFNTNFLKISDNNGAPFSWEMKYASENPIYFSVDNSQSGSIYLADKNYIYYSNDYGENFSLFKKLERKIVGIYKKPNSNKLYAATKYNLYEITPDSIKTIKHLQIDPEIFSWFPLHVGDKWVYKNTFYGDYDQQREYISVWELIRYVSYNDKYYAEIKKNISDKNEPFSPQSDMVYFRTDSTSGRIYIAYLENDSLKEKLYIDLTLDIGDTIYNYNNKVPYIHDDKLTCFSQENFQIFDLDTERKEYATNFLSLTLVKGLGLFYYYGGALVWSDRTLKGAVINGIVYGDTTLTDIQESNSIPISFSLLQNYPNPFNPSTKIKYSIPNVETKHASSLQIVILKVYDILGREIVTLVNKEQNPGNYEVEFSGSELPSGIYFYKLSVGDFHQTRKMILLR